MRDQQKADDHPPHDVAHHQLQERHVAAVGEAGNADDSQRAGFGGHDGERDRPPRHVAVGEEVVAQRALPLAEADAKGGDPRQVHRDDNQVQPIQSHGCDGVPSTEYQVLSPERGQSVGSPSRTNCWVLGTRYWVLNPRYSHYQRKLAQKPAIPGPAWVIIEALVAIYLGIDGGGTQTTCAVGDDFGVLATAVAGGSNMVRVGEHEARSNLREAVIKACAAAQVSTDSVEAAVVGIAGASVPPV